MRGLNTVAADVKRGPEWLEDANVWIHTINDEVRIELNIPYGDYKRQRILVDITRSSLPELQAALTRAILYERKEDD